MWWILWISLIGLPGVLVIYLLFASWVLEVDSAAGLYRFSLVPVFYVRWVSGDFPPYAEMRILGFRRTLDFSDRDRKRGKPVKRKRSHPKIRFRSSRMGAVLHSFRVRNFYLNIDTGDMALNGRLFPWVYLIRAQTGLRCYINFTGNQTMQCIVKNNLYRVIRAYYSN